MGQLNRAQPVGTLLKNFLSRAIYLSALIFSFVPGVKLYTYVFFHVKRKWYVIPIGRFIQVCCCKYNICFSQKTLYVIHQRPQSSSWLLRGNIIFVETFLTDPAFRDDRFVHPLRLVQPKLGEGYLDIRIPGNVSNCN